MITGHGVWKFPQADLLVSSRDRGWRGVASELRSHPAGEIPPIRSSQIEVTLALSGNAEGHVNRRGNGETQRTAVAPGTIWLCPAGVDEDCIFISERIDRVAHVYLPTSLFADLSREGRGAAVTGDSIAYAAGLSDRLLEQIILAIVAELMEETAGGQLLVETLTLAMAARLAGSYSASLAALPSGDAGALDPVRLRRVLDFIREELEGDLSVGRLADIACLSRFHFSRAFQRAVGVSPNRYVSTQRLSHAKDLLAASQRPIADIALACGFSSQANFNRAFVRATGVTPGRYRLHGLAARR